MTALKERGSLDVATAHQTNVAARGATNGRGTKQPRSQKSKNARRDLILPWATVISILALIEILSRLGIIPATHLPPPSVVTVSLFEQFQSSLFWEQLWNSVLSWAVGFTVGSLAGIIAGLIIGSIRFIERSLRVIIEVIRPIPPIAILPLVVLLLGSGMSMKIYLVMFAAFFPVLIQTIYGVQDVDPVMRDTARIYRYGPIRTMRQIVLPSALPYIGTSVRLAASIAMIVTVATELIVGTEGLGYAITLSRYAGDTAAMYALVFVTGVLGYIIAVGIRKLEARVLSWHASYRSEGN